MPTGARPNSDELAIVLALAGRLAMSGSISEETLQMLTEQLHQVAVAGEPPEGGITRRFLVEFKDGTVYEHFGDPD